MKNQLTPIEWLEEQVKANLKDPLSPKFQELFDRAKALEIEHLRDAFEDGAELGEMFNNENRCFRLDAKQYINDKYQEQ